MIRSAASSFFFAALAFTLLLTAACSGPAEAPTPVAGPKPEERAQQQVQQQALLNQRLSALQEQTTRLDKKLSDLRLENEQRTKDLIAESQLLARQVMELREQLKADTGLPARPSGQPVPAAAPPVAPPVAPPAAVAPGKTPAAPGVAAPGALMPAATPSIPGQVLVPPALTAPPTPPAATHSGWNIFFRLLLVVLIVVMLWFIVRIFMGRWGEEEEGEEDDEPGLNDMGEEIKTEEGRIHITPEARTPPASPDEDDNDERRI